MFVMTRIFPELHDDTVRSMDQRTSKPGPAGPAPNTPEREFHARPNWVEVDGTAMAHNVRALRRLAGSDVKVFAALKGNACGFGVAEAARVIAAAGADALTTVDLGDAIRIRKHGVRLPLLLYGGNLPTAEAVRAVLDYDLTPTFHDRYSAEGFLRLADAPLRAFVEVNVGGERLGVDPGNVLSFVQWLAGFPRLEIAGIYAHMQVPASDMAEKIVHWQFDRFQSVLGELDAAGIEIPVHMTASSKTLVLVKGMYLNAIDPGHLVFGLDTGGVAKVRVDVRSALVALKSRLISVRAFTRSEFLDHAPFPLREGLRFGVIPLGSSDGLKSLHGGKVLVRGRRVDLLGSPSAEHARVDLTDVPDAEVGDEVVIIGRQGHEVISLEDVQRHQGGVRASDITRRIPVSIPRRYLEA